MKNRPMIYFVGGVVLTLVFVQTIWEIGKWGKYEGKSAEKLYDEGFSCALSKASCESIQSLNNKTINENDKTMQCLLNHVSLADTISLGEFRSCNSPNRK